MRPSDFSRRDRSNVSGPTVVAIHRASGQAGWSVTKMTAAQAIESVSHSQGISRRIVGSGSIAGIPHHDHGLATGGASFELAEGVGCVGQPEPLPDGGDHLCRLQETG